MNMEVYRAAAMRTSPDDGHDKIDNGALGLIGESGELVDVIKKYKYQSGADPIFPAQKVADELGDVLWYITELCDGLNWKLYDLCGADFKGLDTQKLRFTNRRATPESAILSLHLRATEVYRAIHRSEWGSVRKKLAQMMYCATHIARMSGYTLEKIAEANIRKLRKRYPNGFDAEISRSRTQRSMEEGRWERRY